MAMPLDFSAALGKWKPRSAHGLLYVFNEYPDILIGKIGNRHGAYDGDDAGQKALQDEDPACKGLAQVSDHGFYSSVHEPSPASDAGLNAARSCRILRGRTVVLAVSRAQIAMPMQLTKAVCEDTRKSRSHTTNEVEDSIALLEVVAWVPAGQQIGTSYRISASSS